MLSLINVDNLCHEAAHLNEHHKEHVAYVYNAPDLFDQPNDLPADDDSIPY